MSTAEKALRILLLGALACALAVSCGLIAPIEPLPKEQSDASASAGTQSVGGSSTAGSQNEMSGSNAGGDAGADASAGQSGATLGGAGEPGSNGGSGPRCGPETVLDITDRVDPGAEMLEASERGLGLTSRGNGVGARLNASTYRVFALDTSSRIVQTDVPRDPQIAGSGQWSDIGADFYQFHGSPVAIAESETRMRVFATGFGSSGVGYFDLNQGFWDGTTWTWSYAGVQLLSDPAVVATGLGNLLIVGRCSQSRVCVNRQPLSTLEVLQESSWKRLDVQTNFQPVAVERTDGVHLAATASDGSVMHGHQRPGESEFEWTRLDGMCFRSAPALASRVLSLDVFGQGQDGALYWQSRVGEEWQGWVKISRVFGSAPLAVTDGADGLLVASTDDQGFLWVRRFSNGLWTEWISFRNYGASIADQPFPGSALVLGQGDIRLVVQDVFSRVNEIAFTR